MVTYALPLFDYSKFMHLYFKIKLNCQGSLANQFILKMVRVNVNSYGRKYNYSHNTFYDIH